MLKVNIVIIKQVVMTQEQKIIDEFIQFVAEAGGKVDFEQARYWGLTFLEHKSENNNDILPSVISSKNEYPCPNCQGGGCSTCNGFGTLED